MKRPNEKIAGGSDDGKPERGPPILGRHAGRAQGTTAVDLDEVREMLNALLPGSRRAPLPPGDLSSAGADMGAQLLWTLLAERDELARRVRRARSGKSEAPHEDPTSTTWRRPAGRLARGAATALPVVEKRLGTIERFLARIGRDPEWQAIAGGFAPTRGQRRAGSIAVLVQAIEDALCEIGTKSDPAAHLHTRTVMTAVILVSAERDARHGATMTSWQEALELWRDATLEKARASGRRGVAIAIAARALEKTPRAVEQNLAAVGHVDARRSERARVPKTNRGSASVKRKDR